jgi:DNA topoisomerase VI subunit B
MPQPTPERKPGTELKREVAVLNRAMEFFTQKELTARMGGGPELWPAILVKELIDNSLDATEAHGPPCIEVMVGADGFTVSDNGPGLTAQIIERSLNYNIRVSDKSLYVTPTRGQLGNALKCVWAAPFVAHGNKASSVIVHAGGFRHTIRVRADQIQGCPVIDYPPPENGQPVKTGTSIEVAWPGIACCGSNRDGLTFYRLVQGFATLNPHASFRYKATTPVLLPATDTAWKKWLPNERPSPHWYDLGRFRSLIAGKLASSCRSGARPQRLRDVIGENFCGLTSTVTRSELLREVGLEGRTLEDLARGETLDDDLLKRLLAAMQESARPVQPNNLGVIGKPHMTTTVVKLFGADEHSVRYQKAVLEVKGLPYVLEVAFGYHSGETPLALVTGVNWSPSPRCPFSNLWWLLRDSGINNEDPCVLIAHLACPRPEFTDTGKTILSLPTEVEKALQECVKKACLVWHQLCLKIQRERDRERRLEKREIAESLRQEKAGFLDIKEACIQVMEEAYREASGNGARPAEARQIMYAARRLIIQRKLTDPEKGKDGFFKCSSSFTQRVLPDFMEDNPELTKGWDVAFDDRGHFAEPHTGLRIGIGTLAVRSYMRKWFHDVDDSLEGVSLRSKIDTCGPANRYQFALFVEKEGFDALLASARIQERYDIAIFSTKGMSVTACRQLVERLSREGVIILVLHDFDKTGISIFHTLRSNTRRHKYGKKPKVIDIGLRLKDVKRLKLTGERVTYKSQVDPRINLRKSGASEAECDFLVSGGRPGKWEGRRVELNEATSPQLIAFLEGKLRKAGVKKVVPEGEALEAAYRLQFKKARVERAINKAFKDMGAEDIEVPADLRKRLEKRIKGKPVPWDEVLSEIAKEEERQRHTEADQGCNTCFDFCI